MQGFGTEKVDDVHFGLLRKWTSAFGLGENGRLLLSRLGEKGRLLFGPNFAQKTFANSSQH